MAAKFPDDNTNSHVTAIMVVLKVFPQIMKEMICNDFPPQTVIKLIENNKKYKANITEKQMSNLKSNGYDNLEISFLYHIIRSLGLLPEPNQGWGNIPLPEDINKEDDVERMTNSRNDIIHRRLGDISEPMLNEFLNESLEIAKRMDDRIGYPKKFFESKLEQIRSHMVTQEKYTEALESLAEYREKLQKTPEGPLFELYYDNNIHMKIVTHKDHDENGDSKSACTIYLRDPSIDANTVIQNIDAIKEIISNGDYAINLKDANRGSLKLNVTIRDTSFITKEELHKTVQSFLHEFFLAASIPFKQGQIYTVVLAESDYLVEDDEKKSDFDYLNEKPSPVLKLNVSVKDSAFQNEFELYREVNSVIAGIRNAIKGDNVPSNGSAREAFILTDNEFSKSSTPSSTNIQNFQRRMPQVAVKLVSETESNYFKIFILIFNISHQAVGIKFDDVIQPDHLRYTLGLNMSKLTSLKDKGCINQTQWNSMFPRINDPTSQTFDTSLMICLLRNLAGIQITNELPLWSELTVGADLSRIMTHRKYISNSNDRTLQNDKFAAIWKEIEDAVIRLSNEKLTIDCSTLQTKNFYVDDSQSIYATIQGWKRLVQIEEKNEDANRFETQQSSKKQDLLKKEIEDWEEERKWFQDTNAFNFIRQHLDERLLVVVGNPGMGKSMLLHQTALYLKTTKGYTVVPCFDPSDIFCQYKKYTKPVFILDDACGRFTLVKSSVDRWKQYENIIARVLENKQAIILASCRSQVFQEKQCQSLLIFSGFVCDLNASDCAITKQEKLNIAHSYLSQNTIDEIESDLQSFDMFPLLCCLFKDREIRRVVSCFQNPFDFLKTELDSFNNKDGVLRCCSLFLCVIHGGSLNHDKLMDETESEFYRTLKATFEAFDINQSISRKEVLDSLDTHLNIYLKKKDGQYSVLHHRLLDFLFYYFGQRYQQLIINFADSEMIRDRTVLQSLDIIPQEFTILIDGQNETDYIQRLVKDMLSDHINDVLYNHQMIHKDFRSKLVSHLQKLNDDDLTVTYVFSSIILETNGKTSQMLPLTFACRYGYKELSVFFLSKTKDINAYDGNNIPLITACRKEDAYLTGLLLGKGADVNQTDALGCSPLLWACVHRNLNIVTMLLNEGAVTENIEVYSKSSPLIWVFLGEFLYLCKSAHITEDFHFSHNVDEFPSLLEGNINGQFYTQEEIIDAFLTVLQNGYSRGCIIAKDKYAQSKTPRLVRPVQNILEIIYRGNTEVYFDTSFQPNTASPFVEVMNLFFARGIDIDKSSIGGITALCFACMIDIHNSPFVSYLLSNGASVHKCDNEGTYPLEIAIRLGKEGLVKILIDNGANVNLPVEGISPIDWAIRKENMCIVDSLINAGANLDKRYENGTTLLHFAIKSENDELLKSLIRGGISVTCEDYSGETPLMIAVNHGLVNIVTILITEGAEADTCNSNGISPLMLASSKGDFDIVNMMLRNTQFTPSRTVNCLFSACRNNYLKLVGLLIDRGFDTNITEPNHENTCLLEASNDGYTSMVALFLDNEANVNASNRAGDTPLIMASMNGHTTIVRLLIARKADMYKSNKKGECALIVACKNNHLEIVKVLIDNGCNIECTEKKKKQTCLSVASYRGYENIVAFFIDQGADVNTQTNEGDTPLKLATAKRHFNIVKMLVEHKANINFRDKEGSTPVSGAICSGNDEIVAYLIEHEANVNTQDLKGFTPLMLAASKGHYNIVKMLVENKGDITPQNEEGFTCVSEASAHGNDAILAYFIEHGADVNIPNIKGNTPLMLAASNGHLNIVQMLLEHQAGVTIWDKKGIKNKLEFLIHERAINKANNSGYSSLMLASKNGHASIVQMLLDNGANMYIINKKGWSCLSLARKNGHYEVMDILRQNIPYSYSFSDNSFLYLVLADLFIYILGLYFY